MYNYNDKRADCGMELNVIEEHVQEIVVEQLGTLQALGVAPVHECGNDTDVNVLVGAEGAVHVLPAGNGGGGQWDKGK